MKKSRLLLVTLLTVVVSGAALARSQWTSAPVAGPAPAAEAPGDLDTPAAWRYRQAQPSHWRTCLLQR